MGKIVSYTKISDIRIEKSFFDIYLRFSQNLDVVEEKYEWICIHFK